MFRCISFTAMAFIFQACYGIDRDYMYDVKFTGTVKSKTTNLPIKGIKITVSDKEYIFGFTDKDGKFDFYAHIPNMPNYSDNLKITFSDIDGPENGSFTDKTITVDSTSKDEIVINVELEEKE